MLFDVGDDDTQNIAVDAFDIVNGLVQLIIGSLLLPRHKKGAGSFATEQKGIGYHIDGRSVNKNIVVML